MSKKYQSIRLFKNPVLEALSHVHPIVPLVLWTPIIFGLLYYSIAYLDLGWTEIVGFGVIGLIIWTLTEYLLHRYIFHFVAKSKTMKRFVFLFHGLHHDDPNDPTRLVMPPGPALLIATILYWLFRIVIPFEYSLPFMAFFLIGYLCYDYIHFATHHHKMNSKVGQLLKKWHLKHHYQHDNSKYGVSSPLWDYVFGTKGD